MQQDQYQPISSEGQTATLSSFFCLREAFSQMVIGEENNLLSFKNHMGLSYVKEVGIFERGEGIENI